MAQKNSLSILLVVTCVLIVVGAWLFSKPKAQAPAESQPTPETAVSPQVATARQPEPLPAEDLERLRLRGEVTSLRQERSNLLQLKEENAQLREQLAATANSNENQEAKEEKLTQEQQALRQAAIMKMNFTRAWCLAFSTYAQQNKGQMPATYDEARAFLPEPSNNSLDPNQFEIVFQGSLQQLQESKGQKASEIIILRERNPVVASDGTRSKAYAFADGHSEVRKEPPEGFDQWERERILKGN